ncbi:MAG: hypothetical protein K2W95_04315 [Candidatus Obscuribacterales bacterium]|nr:hypothetical protein [Candidatus Obscuribacterales bacterium]
MELRVIIAQAHEAIASDQRDQAEMLYKQAVALAETNGENPLNLYLVLNDFWVFYRERTKTEEAEKIEIRINEVKKALSQHGGHTGSFSLS